MIVIDASALVEVLLRSGPGTRLRQRILELGGALHAPHLVDLEVLQVLRRQEHAGELRERGAELAVRRLGLLRLRRHSHPALVRRAWHLRQNLTGYDASYVALAELLGATLLTLDRRMAEAPGITAQVEVVGAA